MKVLKKLILGALLTGMATELVYATNGDNMIGVSPASRAMGGLGTGICLEPTDAIFRNPGWLARQDGFNISFGGIIFMPQVEGRSVGPAGDSGWVKSDANLFFIPEIAITNQIDENLVIGLGAYGVSGMGVDYRNEHPSLANMHTSLQFMRFVPAIGYKINKQLAIGGALHLAWGALDMGYTDNNGNHSGGVSNSYGIGFSIGVNFKPLDDICLGAYYQSPISMKYKNVLYNTNGTLPPDRFEDLKLEQPQEVSIGVGYRPFEGLKLGFDIRWINWSDAEGYKQFKWDDQWVFAVGGEYYATPKLALRLGYNYAKSPIKDASNLNTAPATANNYIPNLTAPFPDFNVAYFNLIGFPAITEHHITMGFGYHFTEHFTMNMSYVYAVENKVEATGVGGAYAGAKNSQHSIGISLDWNF
ncbi:MAG: aromatic hydrocarbon degradation protein [Persephonella sp.]|nr:MAG: aromatic hydrocarbon degradation protein [Persephonella sp.]